MVRAGRNSGCRNHVKTSSPSLSLGSKKTQHESDSNDGRDDFEGGESTNSSFMRRNIPHRIIPWANVPRGEETLEISDHVVVRHFGVPTKVITRFLKKEMKERDSLFSLPFALLFVVAYCTCFLNHDQAVLVGDVEHAISVDLHENAVFAYTDPGWMAHKDFNDVHNIPDVYSWLRVGLCPLLFKEFQGWSELTDDAPKWPEITVPQDEKHLYMTYNRLIGGLELTQLRGELRPCPNQEVSDVFNLKCIPQREVLDLNLHIEPEPLDILMSKIPSNASLTRFFLAGSLPNEVALRLRQLELTGWITNATVQASAHFMSYNAHHDTLTLTGAMFFFSRSGKVWKQIVYSTFVLHFYDDAWGILWDAIFVTMLASLLFTEMKELISTCKTIAPGKGYKKFIKKYVDVWNAIDWISIFAGGLLVCLFIVQSGKVKGLKDDLVNNFRDDLAEPSSIFEERHVERRMHLMFEKFRDAQNFSRYVQLVACSFPLVLVMRLFKSFNAQPKLALVTRTMVRASNDLFHFGLVFVATFFSFAMMANALFAHELLKFRTFSRSLTSSFEMLMGEFDFSQIDETGRTLGHIWFISFQMLLVLIMVNMLLAIIMDVYTDVKSKMRDDCSITVQIRDIWQTWRQIKAGTLLSNETIYHNLARSKNSLDVHANRNSQRLCIDSVERDYLVMQIDDFVTAVPGIPMQQATQIMEKAVMSYRHEHELPMGLSDAMHAISKTQKKVSRVLDILDNVTTGSGQSRASYSLGDELRLGAKSTGFARSSTPKSTDSELTPKAHTVPSFSLSPKSASSAHLDTGQDPNPQVLPVDNVNLDTNRNGHHGGEVRSMHDSSTVASIVELELKMDRLDKSVGSAMEKVLARIDQQQDELGEVNCKLDKICKHLGINKGNETLVQVDGRLRELYEI